MALEEFLLILERSILFLKSRVVLEIERLNPNGIVEGDSIEGI